MIFCFFFSIILAMKTSQIQFSQFPIEKLSPTFFLLSILFTVFYITFTKLCQNYLGQAMHKFLLRGMPCIDVFQLENRVCLFCVSADS
jgi:hypothetical protein